MSCTENGFVTTSCTMALRPEARSRWAAKPVISRIFSLGKSRAAASARAMPSMTGIWMSVSSRSNVPCSRVRISSASAPSSAVTVSWPSMAMARATSERIESSSSAISTRGMKSSLSPRRNRRPDPDSGLAGQIPLVEKTYVNIAAFGRRRSQPRLEVGLLAGLEHRLLEHRVPGVDLRALRVADGKAQPRQFDRFPGLGDDHAFDDQHRLAVDGLVADLDVLERQPAQVHFQPDHRVERRS